MFSTGNQLLTDACSWYMKGFLIINLLFFNTNIKSVLTLLMLSRVVKAYRKLKTPVVKGCQKRNLFIMALTALVDVIERIFP